MQKCAKKFPAISIGQIRSISFL